MSGVSAERPAQTPPSTATPINHQTFNRPTQTDPRNNSLSVTTRLLPPFFPPPPADSYSRHVHDPEVLAQTYEGFATRIVWASILHPFDLLATRMMTESAPEVRGSVWVSCGDAHWSLGPGML